MQSTVIKNESEPYYSRCFQLLLLIFLGTGLALSFSLSYSFSIQQGRNVGGELGSSEVGLLSLFLKQLAAAVLGIAALFFLQKIPTKLVRDTSGLFSFLAILAMFLTYLFAPEINGVRRWIQIMGVSVQTGDFARIVLIVYLAHILAQYSTLVKSLSAEKKTYQSCTNRLFFFLLIVVSLYGGTLYLQGDFSSLLIFFSVTLALILSSDLRKIWKVGFFLGIVCIFIVVVINDPVRMLRIFSYLNPNSDLQGSQFQLEQSYDLIRSGGFLGRGLGSSMLDVLFLPYFNNDFVFSIILNEVGVLGIFMVVGLFWGLSYYCFKICSVLYYTHRFYYFVTLALLLNIIISALGHILVILGYVPTAGLNLPFYSTGGTSLVSTLITFAFFLRAAQKADQVLKTRKELRGS